MLLGNKTSLVHTNVSHMPIACKKINIKFRVRERGYAIS